MTICWSPSISWPKDANFAGAHNSIQSKGAHFAYILMVVSFDCFFGNFWQYWGNYLIFKLSILLRTRHMKNSKRKKIAKDSTWSRDSIWWWLCLRRLGFDLLRQPSATDSPQSGELQQYTTETWDLGLRSWGKANSKKAELVGFKVDPMQKSMQKNLNWLQLIFPINLGCNMICCCYCQSTNHLVWKN